MLLAVLLSEAGQIVTVDRLIDELWEGEPPTTVHKSVQSYIVRLRRLLDDEQGRTLVTVKSGCRARGYQLVVGPDDLDAQVFDGLVAEGRQKLAEDACEPAADLLRKAIDLWRGSPLADVPPTPMVAAEVCRLEERHREVTELHIEANLRCGRHAEFVTELESLVAAHPLRETLCGQLMAALYNTGRQADALRVYHDLRTRLADELGVDPGPAVQNIYQKMLAADPALLGESDSSPGADIPRQLPYSTGAFTGRPDELARLGTFLRSTATQRPVIISAIDGIGGVGKSALAIRIAHDLIDQFPDGQLYVDLCGSTVGLAPLSPEEVLGRFLRSLGGEEIRVPPNVEEAAARYRSIVADRRLLLVLDNASDADQVRPLLPAGTGCAVLVTSRRALPELDGATHMRLDVLPEDQAVALLERAVRRERTITAGLGESADVVEAASERLVDFRLVQSRAGDATQCTTCFACSPMSGRRKRSRTPSAPRSSSGCFATTSPPHSRP